MGKEGLRSYAHCEAREPDSRTHLAVNQKRQPLAELGGHLRDRRQAPRQRSRIGILYKDANYGKPKAHDHGQLSDQFSL